MKELLYTFTLVSNIFIFSSATLHAVENPIDKINGIQHHIAQSMRSALQRVGIDGLHQEGFMPLTSTFKEMLDAEGRSVTERIDDHFSSHRWIANNEMAMSTDTPRYNVEKILENKAMIDFQVKKWAILDSRKYTQILRGLLKEKNVYRAFFRIFKENLTELLEVSGNKISNSKIDIATIDRFFRIRSHNYMVRYAGYLYDHANEDTWAWNRLPIEKYGDGGLFDKLPEGQRIYIERFEKASRANIIAEAHDLYRGWGIEDFPASVFPKALLESLEGKSLTKLSPLQKLKILSKFL